MEFRCTRGDDGFKMRLNRLAEERSPFMLTIGVWDSMFRSTLPVNASYWAIRPRKGVLLLHAWGHLHSLWLVRVGSGVFDLQ